MLGITRLAAPLALITSALALGCETAPDEIDAAPMPALADAARADDASSPDAAAKPDAAPATLDAAGAAPDAAPVLVDAAEQDAAPADAAISEGTRPDATVADGSTRDAAAVSEAGGPGCEDCCADGFARGPASRALTRIASFTPSPEGVTVCPSGDVFVTVDGPDEIQRVPLDGRAPERVASLAGIQPAGIDCDERGRLFVAGFARRDGSPAPPIVMIARAGAAAIELPAPQSGVEPVALNGIVAVPGAGIFASDTTGAIFRAREREDGSFETLLAADDLLGANGLAFDGASRTLYVALSFLPAQVVSFRVGADGTLSGRKQEGPRNLLTFFDGVAVDAAGTLYVADYGGGAVLRGADATPIAMLSDPASFAFRGGTLLITSYHLGDPQAEGGLYALQLGSCGARRWH